MRRIARHLAAVGAALAVALGAPVAGALGDPVAAALGGPVAGAAQQGSAQGGFFAIGGLPTATLVEIPARVAGHVVVRFHGDPATGCAARGLCGYSGTILWTPPASGSLEILQARSRGRRRVQGVDLFLADLNANSGNGGGVTEADVEQAPPTSASPSQPSPSQPGPSQPGPSCADASSAGTEIPLAVRQGRVQLTLASASPSPVQTRCAGPLLADLASGLVAPAPTLGAARHGAITLHLTGSHSFAAHGFAGSADSTLTIRLGRPHRARSLSSKPTGPTRRYREVQVGYRVTVAGRVTAAVSGDADLALCGPLGACGRHGTVSLVPSAAPAQTTIDATGPASRPRRDFLTALGLSAGGRARGITVSGYLASSQGGIVTADSEQGSVRCRDSARLDGSAVLLAADRGRLSAQYVTGQGSGDPLRTRCPGPLGSPAPLASGSAPLRVLSRRRATLSLDRGGRLLDDGYSGASIPHLTLTLTRQRLRTLVFSAVGSGQI